jgi:predicted dehydrogenase
VNNKIENIAVLGGGRWARVIIKILASITPNQTKIVVHTNFNHQRLLLWIIENKLSCKVTIKWGQPDYESNKYQAAVIVNSARHHGYSIKRALSFGVPVLVEKPITLSFNETKKLIKLSNESDILFSAAHVFQFASYLHKFAIKLHTNKNLHTIQINWSDPGSETRYGERKSFDPGTPIFADVLPHLISITDIFFKNEIINMKNVCFEAGGSSVELNLECKGVKLVFNITRNAKSRVREINVIGDEKLTLDFSKEPGKIILGNTEDCADPDWTKLSSPMTMMISTFLNSVETKNQDDRLSSSLGLSANLIIDQVSNIYDIYLFNFLSKIFVEGIFNETSLTYSLMEILLNDQFFAPDEAQVIITKAIKKIKTKQAITFISKSDKSNIKQKVKDFMMESVPLKNFSS